MHTEKNENYFFLPSSGFDGVLHRNVCSPSFPGFFFFSSFFIVFLYALCYVMLCYALTSASFMRTLFHFILLRMSFWIFSKKKNKYFDARIIWDHQFYAWRPRRSIWEKIESPVFLLDSSFDTKISFYSISSRYGVLNYGVVVILRNYNFRLGHKFIDKVHIPME